MTKYLHAGLKSADAQSITGTRVYDAFGNVESSSGSWTGAFGYGGPYGYQSASEGGLMLLGHRYYDPSTGRFLTRDPIKDGRNWYGYVGGSPLKYSDPSGLIRIGDFEFTLDVVIEGIKTGAAGLANGMTGGRFRGDRYRDHPGFGFAVGAGKVASGSLIGAGGVGGVAMIPRAKLIVANPGTVSGLTGSGAVIGNSMRQRVLPEAARVGGAVFTPSTTSKLGGWVENFGWILRQVFTKDWILDIGPDPGRPPRGPWYIKERIVTRVLCR